MKRYQIVNRPSDGLELRQLDETAKHINELWARLTEFGEEFKKSTDTLTQAAGSLAGRVTVLETPPATEEPTDPEPTPPPIPTIVAAAAGGFINATVSTLEPVDSYDCQLQEEAVEDPPTEWQNAKYGTFSFIPPLPNTNYVVWARSRRAYLQSDWATSDVVNSGFLPYLLLDASNDPLTGTLEISLPPQSGQTYLESPALSIQYTYGMTSYDLFKIWDNFDGLGTGPWLSLGLWSMGTGVPPAEPQFGHFNVDYGPLIGSSISATLETTDSAGDQAGRINFYDSSKAFVNKDGDSLFQHGVFENSINVTGTGDYSCAVYIAEYSGNAAIEYYYYTTSWLKYAYQNVSGFFIDWTNYDEPRFWIGDTAWRDGLWLQADGFGLLNYSGSEFGSTGEIAWINAGSLLLYSFSEGTPPFVLTGNNTGVLVTGLNSDLLDGYHAEGVEKRHGFASRTDNTISLSTRTVSVTPTGSTFDLYLTGVKYAKTTSSTTFPNTVGLHYTYFDSAGVLQNSMVAWNIRSPNTPVATVYWNGSAGAMIDERHGADRNLAWHEWAHLTIGTRYYTGLAGTFTDSTFSIAAGTIYDEDLDHAITIAKTACRLFYRSTGTFTFESGVTTPYKATAGVLQYDNGGGLSNVTAGRYITNWVYAGGDTAYPIYIIVSQAEYTTIAAAREATPPATGNLPVTEMKLLYGVIYRYSGGAITYQEAIDFRAVAGPTGTYIASDHGVLSGLADDDHPQYALIDGTRPFTGAVTVGADAAGYDVTLYGATSGKKLLWDESADTLQVDGAFDLNGGATLGGADTDLLTCVGRLIVRTVADGDMDATAGTVAEVVFNSADSKFYGCTVSGSPATWAALN